MGNEFSRCLYNNIQKKNKLKHKIITIIKAKFFSFLLNLYNYKLTQFFFCFLVKKKEISKWS